MVVHESEMGRKLIMKNILFLFVILFANLAWTQVTINGSSTVEVDTNYNYSINFNALQGKPNDYIDNQNSANNRYVTTYKITSWYVVANPAVINNTNSSTYSSNSDALNSYSISTPRNINLNIKWPDNSDSQSAILNAYVYVTYYFNDGGLAASFIRSTNLSINVNRILTPVISTPTILTCCDTPVTFSASNYGAANIFNWTVSGGSYTGSGASISVTPNSISSAVIVSCTVRRNPNLAKTNIINTSGRIALPNPIDYFRTSTVTVNKTVRTASFTALYPEYYNGTPPFQYICKNISGSNSGSGRQMSMQSQCGFSSVNWIANGCTIAGQGTLNPTITPLATTSDGSEIEVYAIVNFVGGCTATTPKLFMKVQNPNISSMPSGTFTITPNNGTVCTAEIFDINFTSSNTENGLVTYSPHFFYGPNDPVHHTTSGFVTVTVCNRNLCTGLSNCRSYNISKPAPCGGGNRLIANNNEEKISILPNPTNGNVNVVMSKLESGNYQVFDQNSILIQETKFMNQNELPIALSEELKSGIYVLKIITENNVFTEKIILKK